MTFLEKLAASRAANQSLVCVGLDPDMAKLPKECLSDSQPLLAFNKAIIDATADLVSAYKPNSAFYEAHGADGWVQLQSTVAYINQKYPEIPVILDAKRADIGNTNQGYVHDTYENIKADAITLHPYLGSEALLPFLERADKGCIVLCRTSNPGAGEFQNLQIDGRPLFQHVAQQVATWNSRGNCLLVVGATYPDEMKIIRQIVGENMAFLVPGVGAQGGDVKQVLAAGGDNLIINSSRAILYASSGDDFAEAARAQTVALRDEINMYRKV